MISANFKKYIHFTIFNTSLIAALTACGGGESSTSSELGSLASQASSAPVIKNSETNISDSTDVNPAPSIQPIVANITSSSTSGEAGLKIKFSVQDISGSANTITNYQWNFDDGHTSSKQVVYHIFPSAGNYTISVTITDQSGQTDDAAINVAITEPTPATPMPPISSPIISPTPAVPPVAAMSANPTHGEANLNVRFTASNTANTQSAITSYIWNFGDGATSRGASVSHTYTSAGTYIANITLTNADGLTSRAIQQIIVNESAPPIANMSASTTRGEATLRVNFAAEDASSSSSPINRYQWNLGDGSSATGPSVSHSYTRAGTFLVVVTITNENGQSANTSQQITVTEPVVLAPPVASINASPVRGEAALQVNFSGIDTSNSGSAITSYQWDFGDGDTTSGASVMHDYTNAGTYTATLTMRNNNGLTATSQQQIIVSEPTPAPPVTLPVAVMSATPTSGATSLLVNFRATDDAGANIVGYNWDFGDGNAASGQNVTHIYDTPNTYTATLTLTDTNGDTDSTTNQIYVFNSISNNQAIVPDGVIFYDDFDYAVSRNSADLPTERAKFIANGWSGAKAVNLTGSHAGYLYTVNRIPGYTGDFPGRSSTRVLAFEAKPDTFGSQTDFYLQYGFGGQTIPADVWFQFWMYINNYDDPTDQEDQMSRFGRKGKILYPTKAGYPSNNGLWMLGCCATNYGPLATDLGDAATGMYMHLADLQYLRFNDGNTSSYKVGQTDLSERFTPNHWMLVKTHIDTSTTSGKFEQWIKPMNGAWTKTADWEDGVSGLNTAV